MTHFLTMSLGLMADSSGAVQAMRDYVAPTIRVLAAIASIASVFFLVNAGYLYMTSSGKPDTLEHAKKVMRNALLGLIIVLAAATVTSILTGAYGHPASGASGALPSLQPIPPEHVSNGLVDILIKAVTGLLNNIIQAVATPFLAALNFFTQSTPLMASNPSVFNLWLTIVGMTDVLFIVILALIGFHVMSAASFGFDEIEFKHLLPRIALIFLLINTSIFIIDGVIEMSNALITAIHHVGGGNSVWDTLTAVVKDAGGQGVAALLVMLAFLIFSVFLLVYYVLRLVTLFIGAVLSPLVLLVWLIPGFRDFSETAVKTYITTIFTLFVHVVILILAASLFTGMAAVGDNHLPDTLMAMVVGLATVLALLKTQSVMMQFSYVSTGSRNARMLGGKFMNGVSYMTKGKGSFPAGQDTRGLSGRRLVAGTGSSKQVIGRAGGSTVNRARPKQESSGGRTIVYTTGDPKQRAKTGATYEAPRVNLRSPGTKSKDKEML